MAFFFVFFGLLKSVSLRVLIDLLESPAFTIDYHFLLEEYLVKDSFAKRIEILQTRKMVCMEDGKLILLQKGRWAISKVATLQDIFMVKRSG